MGNFDWARRRVFSNRTKKTFKWKICLAYISWTPYFTLRYSCRCCVNIMAIFYRWLVVGFIRDEALHAIKFYWEGVLGIAILLLGIRFIFSIFWITFILGCLLIFLGLVITVNFLKRYITLIKQESLGNLIITERQVFYNHPTLGGVISLDTLIAISLVTEVKGPFCYN